jgi:hypothetical protein
MGRFVEDESADIVERSTSPMSRSKRKNCEAEKIDAACSFIRIVDYAFLASKSLKPMTIYNRAVTKDFI